MEVPKLAKQLATVQAVAAAWTHMTFGRRAFFKPEAIVHLLSIAPQVQQDAAEYLTLFLNFITEVTALVLRGREAASVKVLHGHYRVTEINSRKCLICNYESTREEEHRLLVSC